MDKETKLVKDRECIKCEKFFDCKGKPPGIQCVAIVPRKDIKKKQIKRNLKGSEKIWQAKECLL